MDDLEKHHDYFEQVAEHTAPANPPMEEKQESSVNITRRLRDRALLKRKKEDAQDKDTIYEQTRSKRQQRGKGTGRGRRKIEAKELEPEPKQAVEPEPELQPETEPESASVPEPEPEVNVPQEQAENAQELSKYYDDPVTVTEHVAPLVHEEADVHVLQDRTSLLTGNIYTTPIGYIESCFKAKNGTPRQPTICSLSRGCLKISKSVFNNPEHSLIGLEQFSHVWIVFVFHKNGRLSCKAKVQPPRLNGAKTGVFSSRSPHRPNAIGLTLARLEKVEGGTIYLSGIDIIHGTPVLDIKPYIAEYDSPQPSPFCVEEHQEKERPHVRYNDPDLVKAEKDEKSEQVQTIAYQPSNENTFNIDEALSAVVSTSGIRGETQDDKEKRMGLIDDPTASISENQYSLLNDSSSDFASSRSAIQEATSVKGDDLRIDYTGGSFVPSWVRDAPVSSLKVRFTPHSEMELKQFKAQCDSGGPSFSYFQSTEEAKCAITTVLSADPRSVYRRKQCQDRLFYFSLDTIHITCWFGDGFVEVVRIKPLESNAEHQSQ